MHEISVPSGMSWCEDSLIQSMFDQINAFRENNTLPALVQSQLAQQYVDLRAIQFAQYSATNSPQSPNFNPHDGFELTAASIGYNVWSENLAYISQNPAYIVLVAWNDPLHLATLLARQATVMAVGCVFNGFTPYWCYGPGYNDRQGPIVPTPSTQRSTTTRSPTAPTTPTATTLTTGATHTATTAMIVDSSPTTQKTTNLYDNTDSDGCSDRCDTAPSKTKKEERCDHCDNQPM